MLVKSYDLTGGALDWATAKALGHTLLNDGINFIIDSAGRYEVLPFYSSNGNETMHMLKEYKISLMHVEDDDPYPIDDGPWSANIPGQEYGYTGPTPEIAICRCVVAYKLGEDIEIPDELLKDK